MARKWSIWKPDEIEWLRRHYGTTMALTEIYKKLAPHTPKSIRCYAHKTLKVKRPSMQIDRYKARQTWPLVLAMLAEGPKTGAEIQAALGVSRTRVTELLKDNGGWHIIGHRERQGRGARAPIYAAGDGESVALAARTPEQRRDQSNKRRRERAAEVRKAATRLNPWLSAAGMIEVPSTDSLEALPRRVSRGFAAEEEAEREAEREEKRLMRAARMGRSVHALQAAA